MSVSANAAEIQTLLERMEAAAAISAVDLFDLARLNVLMRERMRSFYELAVFQGKIEALADRLHADCCANNDADKCPKYGTPVADNFAIPTHN